MPDKPPTKIYYRILHQGNGMYHVEMHVPMVAEIIISPEIREEVSPEARLALIKERVELDILDILGGGDPLAPREELELICM